MKEQIGFQYVQTKDGKQRLIQRGSLVSPGQGNYYQQANPHRAGYQAGLHREDMPADHAVEEDEEYYLTRPHTSARRYIQPGPYTQGNVRYTVRYTAPPVRQKQRVPLRRSSEEDVEDQHKQRARMHWLVYVGMVFVIGIVGWVGLTALGNWWQDKQDDWTYGNPRTYQTDAVVGHNDSPSSPSHFTAENLRGQIIVVELPGGDPSKGRSYVITSIPGNSGNPPVRVTFQDINHDGKLDMLVEIGDPGSVITVFLFNNGSQFVSKV